MFLCLILFTACSGQVKENQPDIGFSTNEGNTLTASDPNGKYEKIILTYQTFGPTQRLDDLDEVLEEINKISREEIGIEVELKLVNALDAFTDYSLWISKGEQVDLMILNYQDITSYINRGMLLPVDELLEKYGQGILSLVEDSINPMEASNMGGKYYGVANIMAGRAGGCGIWFAKNTLIEAGVEYDEKKIYSLDEIGSVLARLKHRFPDSYPLGQITSGEKASSMTYYTKVEGLSGGDNTSGIIVEKNGEYIAESYYRTEEYLDFIRHMREWYLAGYIYPDSAFTSTSLHELCEEKIVLSYPLASSPGMKPNSLGEDAVCLRTTAIETGKQYSKSGFWVIPVTSASPSNAVKFLNLMMTDERIGNLFNLGIKDKHYVVVDERNKIAAYPEGIDQSNVGYFNPLGLYGDYHKQYRIISLEQKIAEDAYEAEAVSKESIPLEGMEYSQANVGSQLVKVDGVIEKYLPLLESGSVDIDLYYFEFLAELEDAGESEMIADKQKQIDAWLSVH